MPPDLLALRAALFAVAVGALVVAAVTDARRRVIPNGCVLVVAACALACALSSGTEALACSLAGGGAVLAVLLVTAALSARGSGVPGIGGGDVKLLAAAGLWHGALGGLAVVALSCLSSLALWGAAGVIRLAMQRLSGNNGVIFDRKTTVRGIPLGTGIALSFVAIALFGGTVR